MVKNKSTVNFGICQGVVRASPFSPMPGIAMFDVRVKSNRKNPKTKRYEVHVLNFVAKDGKMYENYDLIYIVKPPEQKKSA